MRHAVLSSELRDLKPRFELALRTESLLFGELNLFHDRPFLLGPNLTAPGGYSRVLVNSGGSKLRANSGLFDASSTW